MDIFRGWSGKEKKVGGYVAVDPRVGSRASLPKGVLGLHLGEILGKDIELDEPRM